MVSCQLTYERNELELINQQRKVRVEAKMKAKQVNKQESRQTSNKNMKANKHASKRLKENTTPTPTLTVHGPEHVK